VSVALVTGASRGIGRAVALRLGEQGHDVAIGYSHGLEQAEQVAGELTALGRRAVTVGGDLGDPQAPGRIVGEVEERLGGVDVLVANAGIASAPTGILEVALEDWQRMLAVNLTAPFLLAQRVFPGMLERGFGRIVFLSSVAAYTGGLIGAHGVTVNVIAPGLIDTDMLPPEEGVREQLAASRAVGRLGRSEEVADMVVAVVANAYMSNQSIVIDGGTLPT